MAKFGGRPATDLIGAFLGRETRVVKLLAAYAIVDDVAIPCVERCLFGPGEIISCYHPQALDGGISTLRLAEMIPQFGGATK